VSRSRDYFRSCPPAFYLILTFSRYTSVACGRKEIVVICIQCIYNVATCSRKRRPDEDTDAYLQVVLIVELELMSYYSMCRAASLTIVQPWTFDRLAATRTHCRAHLFSWLCAVSKEPQLEL
jgi:hypothetical protein